MAHKKVTPVPVAEIDTNRTDQEYWEEILRREGLGMNRGMFPHAYVGTSKEVEAIKVSQ